MFIWEGTWAGLLIVRYSIYIFAVKYQCNAYFEIPENDYRLMQESQNIKSAPVFLFRLFDKSNDTIHKTYSFAIIINDTNRVTRKTTFHSEKNGMCWVVSSRETEKIECMWNVWMNMKMNQIYCGIKTHHLWINFVG